MSWCLCLAGALNSCAVCLSGNAQASHDTWTMWELPRFRAHVKSDTKRTLSYTLGLGSHLPEENSWANARDISSKGEPTATNLTMRSRGSSRRSPLRRGPLRSGSRASDSMYSAAVCASDMMLPSFGVQRRQEGSWNSRVRRRQLQAAGFEQSACSPSLIEICARSRRWFSK